MTTYTNALANETSPYLLQHASNPVEWHAWKPEALARARELDRPILLSIGYAACHWCHVMEHESFEDPEIARVMNDNFVCIKVDREERPDLDKIYQTAHHLLTGRAGGWPLNMFLMPDDHTPFFGGTYFPNTPRYGMPAFAELLKRVASYYRDNLDDLQRQNHSLVDAFARMTSSKQGGEHHALNESPIRKAQQELIHSYDKVYGGFGGAPKFPHPTNLEFCLRRSMGKTGIPHDEELSTVVRHSLLSMANGGVNDQVSGGFYRYSVDEQWMIPHFEKMLYDNAQLIPLYTDAGMAFSDEELLATARTTCDWVMREMQSRDGGYYSSLDADSEGEEGRYYVWSAKELRSLLDDRQWQIAASRYGLDGEANFDGRWHLHVHRSIAEVATQLHLNEESVSKSLADIHDTLSQDRATRVRPGLDDKVLTSWNGMMIHAMAHCGRILGTPEYIDSARRALDFVRDELWDGKRLLATFREGHSQLNAYLDDYVQLAAGILELLQNRWDDDDARLLKSLMDAVLEHFEDSQHGAFFFTSDDHEKLLQRVKPDSDDAIPSGNGIAAQLLLKLGHVYGDQRYLESAERTLKSLWDNLNHYPSGHGALLAALDLWLMPPEILVIRGDGKEAEDWKAMALEGYLPDRLVFSIPRDASKLPGLLAGKHPTESTIAYPCRGTSCLSPITDRDEWGRYLAEHTQPST